MPEPETMPDETLDRATVERTIALWWEWIDDKNDREGSFPKWLRARVAPKRVRAEVPDPEIPSIMLRVFPDTGPSGADVRMVDKGGRDVSGDHCWTRATLTTALRLLDDPRVDARGEWPEGSTLPPEPESVERRVQHAGGAPSEAGSGRWVFLPDDWTGRVRVTRIPEGER